jgi:hypothetical protein
MHISFIEAVTLHLLLLPSMSLKTLHERSVTGELEHTLQSFMSQEVHTEAKAHAATRQTWSILTGGDWLKGFFIIFAVSLCWCGTSFWCIMFIKSIFYQETSVVQNRETRNWSFNSQEPKDAENNKEAEGMEEQKTEEAESAMTTKESKRLSLSGNMRRPEDLLASASPELAVKLGLRHSWIDSDGTSSVDSQRQGARAITETMEEVQAIRKNIKNPTLELLRQSQPGAGHAPTANTVDQVNKTRSDSQSPKEGGSPTLVREASPDAEFEHRLSEALLFG